MKTIICEDNKSVDLHHAVSSSQPIVLSFPPFSGEMSLNLSLSNHFSPDAVCFQSAFSRPFYTRSLGEIPETFLLLLKSSKGFIACFCLSHNDLIVRMLSGTNGKLLLKGASGTKRRANKIRPALLCVQGKSLHQTINITMCTAMMLTGGKGKLAHEKPSIPPWLDNLGWESGGAFGKEVTHDKVVSTVCSLRQLGIKIGFVLIDEGWQHVVSVRKGSDTTAAMAGFEADKGKFPFGIKGLVEELQRAGVEHVGLWHGMMGYRGGVHPHLAMGYHLPPDQQGRYFLGYDLGKTFQFYHDFYAFLKDQGISFVKVGDQSRVKSFCRQGMDVTLLHQNLQEAIQAAASIQFDTPPFNGECLCNENLFYWTTSQMANVGRCVNVQSIRDMLTNTLWLKQLMVPEYGSWFTGSEMIGAVHSVCSAINMISDLPGKHDLKQLKKIVLPSGKILKPDKSPTLCHDSVFFDPLEEQLLYKVYTFKGDKGIIAAFNLNNLGKQVHGTVSPSHVNGLAGESFAVYSDCYGFLGVIDKDQEISVTLKQGKADVYTFSPVHNGLAVIGCTCFFLPSAPVVETTIEDESVHISSLVMSQMEMYCERQVLEIRRNGEVIPWELDQERNLLSFDTSSDIVELPAMYTITFE